MKPWEETWHRHYPKRGEPVTWSIDNDARQSVVQTDAGYYVRDEADMALIAAAPELYRALEQACDAVNRYGQECRAEEWRRLLAKARGES